MPGKKYLTEQAATLLRFAKATTDPDIAAGYLAKAAAGVPRDLLNTFVSARVHPIRPTVLFVGAAVVDVAHRLLGLHFRFQPARPAQRVELRTRFSFCSFLKAS